jgi:hypothetical protein
MSGVSISGVSLGFRVGDFELSVSAMVVQHE